MPFGQSMLGAGQAAMNKGKGAFTGQMGGQQQQGLGPSMGAIGGMMGRKMPGMRRGQQQQRNQYGLPFARQERQPQQQQGSEIQQGMGSVLGGSGRMGKRFNMPMQPRQDMYQPEQPNIGMSNIQLPQEQMQQDQMPSEPMGRFGGFGGMMRGLGPRFMQQMQQGYQPQRYEQQQGPQYGE